MLRIASWDPGLTRQGPGLALRDIRAGDAQALAAARVIAAIAPDVILLTGIDWDHDGLALQAFAQLLQDKGHPMAHSFTARPNSGMATGLDMDGDGRRGGPRDAQGFGRFSGQDGMAVLSRLPLGPVLDYSDQLWRDQPGHLMPAGIDPQVAQIQRLSSTAHWDVTVQTGAGPLHLLAWSATPPAFDGDDQRNQRRNHDEAVFWLRHLPDAPFVLIGNINLDPEDGDGRREALEALLEHASDPQPRGQWQPPQTGANAAHRGDPALDTAEFRADRSGNLRVDYVLPSRALQVHDSAVFWPPPDHPLAGDVQLASNHRLVWLDLVWPPAVNSPR